MKLKILTVFLLSIILPTSSIFTYGANSYSPIKLSNTPLNVHIEIRPEIELLAGVLSHTSWMNRRGPKGTGNEYFRELQNFFANYKDHPAIKIAEELTKNGFAYDAPPNFILSLGPLPKLKPINGYSEYLLGRAGGRDQLESISRMGFQPITYKVLLINPWFNLHQASNQLEMSRNRLTGGFCQTQSGQFFTPSDRWIVLYPLELAAKIVLNFHLTCRIEV